MVQSLERWATCAFCELSGASYRQLSSGTSHIATFLPKRYRERNHELCAEKKAVLMAHALVRRNE